MIRSPVRYWANDGLLGPGFGSCNINFSTRKRILNHIDIDILMMIILALLVQTYQHDDTYDKPSSNSDRSRTPVTVDLKPLAWCVIPVSGSIRFKITVSLNHNHNPNQDKVIIYNPN